VTYYMNMNRRDYLGALAGLATAATVPIAGCSTGVGDVPAPELPESRMDGWTRIDEATETVFEEEVGDATIEGTAHTVAYEDEQLRGDVEAAIGEIDHPVAILATSRVAFSGGIGGPAGTDAGIADRVETTARERFESRLREAGIENIERASAETVTVDSGAEARYRRYVADLALDSDAAAATGIDAIPMAGDLATWRAEASSLIAGAAYPAEPLSATIERRGGDASDVDTGYDAAAYREEIRAIITAIT
jgi:hypothetical protein